MANEQNAANAKAVKTYIKKGIGKVRVWIGSGLLAAADVAKVLGFPSGNTLITGLRIPEDQHCHITNEQNGRTVPCLTVEGVRTAVYNRRNDGHQMTAFVEERINRFVDWFEQELAPAATGPAEPVEEENAEYKTIDAGPFGAIRVIIIGDKILFVAQDIARGLGYSRTNHMVRLLDKDEVVSVPWGAHKVGKPQVDSPKSNQPIICITEAGLYHAFSMRRAQCINDPNVEEYINKFQRTMNHEVWPQITRTGAYIPEGYQPPTPALPTDNKMAVIMQGYQYLQEIIDAERQRAEAAEQKAERAERTVSVIAAENEEMRPKAQLVDAMGMLGDGDDVSMRIFSIILMNAGGPKSLGRNNLIRQMEKDGYIGRENGDPVPRIEEIKRGNMSIKTSYYNNGRGRRKKKYSSRITMPKGAIKFVKKYAPDSQMRMDVLEKLNSLEHKKYVQELIDQYGDDPA